MEKNGKSSSSEDDESQKSQEEEKIEEKKEEKGLLKKKRKKSPKKEDNKNENIIVGEKEVIFLLENKRRVTVQKFKGNVKVDIREYYENNGEMKPGKKGISLTLDNWKKLKEFMDDIDESINNLK